MKKLLFLAILGLLVTPDLSAQRPGGWGKNCQYCTRYDVNNVQEFKGEIIRIDQFVPNRGMGNGYEIVLRTTTGERIVHVGPVWYVKDLSVKLQVGDWVEVEGSEFDFNGQLVIMAGEIERNEEKMRLRNERGQPMWW